VQPNTETAVAPLDRLQLRQDAPNRAILVANLRI
jgi:hypothetical protein